MRDLLTEKLQEFFLNLVDFAQGYYPSLMLMEFVWWRSEVGENLREKK